MFETGHYLTYHPTDIIPLFHICNKHNKCERLISHVSRLKFCFHHHTPAKQSINFDRNLVHEYIEKMQVPQRHKSVSVRCRVIPKIHVAIKIYVFL